jgi:KaiC/GvpD/RAD55 family RecA-like ATPase
VPLQLFAERAVDGDGAVVGTTREDPAFAARRFAGVVDTFECDSVALVDCCTKGRDSLSRSDNLRWEVPSPVAFSELSTAVDEAFAALADHGNDRGHFLFDTLGTQFRLAESDSVVQHVHDLAMRLGTEVGLGVFTVESSAVTDQEFERLKHLVDVHVEVRRVEDGPEVRWTGLVGRSDGWVTLADDGIRFDAIGTNLG